MNGKANGGVSGYVDSYYARTRASDTVFDPLANDLEVDACLVGGGMAGVATALGLAERGKSVALVEARRIGWGASGRNGGFVSAGFSRGLRALIDSVGQAQALELYGLSEDAVALVRQRAETIAGADGAGGVAPIVDGRVTCSWFDDRDGVRREADWTNEMTNAGVEVWDREKVRSIWRSPRYYEGLWRPKGFTFHSLDFTRGCATLAARAGARVFENTRVQAIYLDRDPKRVHTTGGILRADQVVICCSGYIEGLVGWLSAATLPIGTYVVLTEPVGERLHEVIGLPQGVSDTRFASDYYRPLPDTRILWGGRISRWTDPPRLAETMMGDLKRVYPQLSDLRAEVAWPGTMGYATHKMPQIGQLRPGVWYSQGYGGHGMAATTLGGEIVASAIAERDERWRLFAPFGLTPVGGPLGAWYAQMVYWGYQTRDAWREMWG
jgi:gamma-glutamylputrescine oxidase